MLADPLHFSKIFCPSPKSKVMMQNIEIFNGRLAMLATVGYVVQEYLTGKSYLVGLIDTSLYRLRLTSS